MPLFLIYSTLTALNTTYIQTIEAQMFKHASDVSGSHTYRYYEVSPMCECANTVYHSDSSLSGGSFTCCNRVYIPRLQEMRGWDVQAWTFPRKLNVMFCPSHWHARNSWVSLTPPIMEYEDFPPHQWPAAMERVRAVFGRLGYLLGCLFPPACVCPAPQSHKAKITEKSWTRASVRAFCLLSVTSCLPKSFFHLCTIPTRKRYRKPQILTPGLVFPCAHLRSCTVGHESVPGELNKGACLFFFTLHFYLRMEGEENNALLSGQVTEAFSPKPCC